MTRLSTTRLKEDSQETGVEVEELSHHSSVPGTHIPLSFPPSNSGPYPGAEPASLASSALANRFLTTSVTCNGFLLGLHFPVLCIPSNFGFCIMAYFNAAINN